EAAAQDSVLGLGEALDPGLERGGVGTQRVGSGAVARAFAPALDFAGGDGLGGERRLGGDGGQRGVEFGGAAPELRHFAQKRLRRGALAQTAEHVLPAVAPIGDELLQGGQGVVSRGAVVPHPAGGGGYLE